MSFFRSLLWWLLLAAFGALAVELLSPDLGEVVVRWHGSTLTTSVAFFLVAWGLLWFALWMLWSLLRLPFTAWQRMAQAQARNRLVNGLVALHEGRHARAESLLEKAAEDPVAASVARLAARKAALRRGDLLSAASQQAALASADPLAAALNAAASLLAQGKPGLAVEALQPWAERNLPPRGLQLRGEALVGAQRAIEAMPLLGALAREQTESSQQLAALERRWQSSALRQSAHADELLQRWNPLPARLREDEALLLAFAERAGQLGLESEAAEALASAIEHEWNESLVAAYGRLPAARDDHRLARAEHWLPRHQDSATLSLALGRLCLTGQQFGKAEEALHRAIAQGAGAEAWEALGEAYTAKDDPLRAQLCYANALRQQRDEAPRPLTGRTLREQIADEAVAEKRDEHGLPHLPR